MRSLVAAACLTLCACAAVPAAPAGPASPTAQTCNSSGTEQFVGQIASTETGEAILRATHSAVLRWAAPGMMLTMDFRADRVTVRFAPDRKITAINCG